jgi:hypothetical protein
MSAVDVQSEGMEHVEAEENLVCPCSLLHAIDVSAIYSFLKFGQYIYITFFVSNI